MVKAGYAVWRRTRRVGNAAVAEPPELRRLAPAGNTQIIDVAIGYTPSSPFDKLSGAESEVIRKFRNFANLEQEIIAKGRQLLQCDAEGLASKAFPFLIAKAFGLRGVDDGAAIRTQQQRRPERILLGEQPVELAAQPMRLRSSQAADAEILESEHLFAKPLRRRTAQKAP